MAQDSKIKEFPDISNKLTAPTKKSLFERQKAEAEAKRQREQEETAAVYEDFIKSFDDEDNSTPPNKAAFGDRGGLGGPGKRHFSGTSAGPTGRGTFGGGRGNSGPGSLGPPPSLSRKRTYDGSPPTQREGLFAFEDTREGPADPKTALQHSDDEDTGGHTRTQERAIPKPTIRLSSLPPGTSPAAIKAILPATLPVEGVRIMPPSGPGTLERRTLSAVVTLAKDTPALDIDTAVSALQNKYMGRGFYLSLSRHLSSAAVGLDTPNLGLSSSSSSLPFGARPVAPSNLGRAPPGGHRGGFAPPASYSSGQFRTAPTVQVNVNPPSDLKQLRLIHKTLEALLTHGPEFEALLMSRKDVQMDEKWAWLWDSRSVGGVYYRWKLWDILTGTSRRRGRNLSSGSQRVFEGGAEWALPERPLQYEYATRLEEFVSDSDYDSSEEEDSGDEGRRRYAHHHGGAPPPDGPSLAGESEAYLNPLQKAKLTHLLARLPTTNAKLRRGDVARITAFAIQHAGEGAEEVVQMITSNVQKPFSFTSANSDRKTLAENKYDEDPADDTPKQLPAEKEKEDTSAAKLIGLYIISDILSSSSTSGVRHAWRYRQLFEAAFKRQKTFEHLGRLDKEMGWGRLRAEKWKRSVQSVLGLWEGWCVFPQASQEFFNGVFINPPLTREEEEKARELEREKGEKEKKGGRWKTVDEKRGDREREAEMEEGDRMDVDADEDMDGEPMVEDEDIDGEPMISDPDSDLDGSPMLDSTSSPPQPIKEEELQQHPPPPPPPPNPSLSRREALAASIAAKLGKVAAAGSTPALASASAQAPPPLSSHQEEEKREGETPAAAARRRRPKAEDMFADSDGE